MWQEYKDSPTRLVVLGCGGGLLLYLVGIGLCFLLRSYLPVHGQQWQSFAGGGHFGVLFAFAVTLAGLGLAVASLLRLGSGIKKGRWTEEALEPLRRRAEAPVCKLAWVSVALIALGGFWLLPEHMRSLAMFGFFPIQMLASVGTSLRRPATSLRVVG